MGKTVTSLLTVAAAIAVNVIPGVGQFISATLISAGLTTAAAAALGAAITTGLTVAGLQAGASLIGLGPKLPKPATTEGAIKTSIPPRVSAYGRSRLYGAYALFETASNGTAVDVFAVHDGRLDAIEQRYLGDDKVTVVGTTVQTGTDKRYQNGAVRWYETTGAHVGAGFPAITALLGGLWTGRGDGVVAIATAWKSLKAEDFQKTYPQSGPVPASIVARWQWCFDWRDPAQSVSNPDTWTWTENAALHLAHYRLVREKARRDPDDILPSPAALQEAWDTFFAPTVAWWTEAANVCAEAVPLLAGGTEQRYRSALAHKHTDAHKDVLSALTACFDGWTSPRADGALVVYAGRYYEPTVEIGPAEIVSYGWQRGVPDEESVNEITISYISAEHDYNSVEGVPWRNYTDMAERGRVRTQPLDLQIPSQSQGRRLAKRSESRAMAPFRGVVTTNVAGRSARGQRYIRLRIIEAGAVFFDGVAEITQLTRNLATGGVTFSWVAADPDIDAWNPATEEGQNSPAAPRVPIADLAAPVINAAVVSFDEATAAGTVGARLNLDITGPDRDDLTWAIRWRVVGDASWIVREYVDTDPGVPVAVLTDFVPINDDLEVQAAYTVGDGRPSDWSATFPVDTTTAGGGGIIYDGGTP